MDIDPNISHVVAYVDGSYNVKKDICGYGIVFTDEERNFLGELGGLIDHPELVKFKNVGGEIAGALYAMKYVYNHEHIKSMEICHDYMGIAAWCTITRYTKEWRRNNPYTQFYRRVYDKVSRAVKVTFRHVESHSGDAFNNLADLIAKKYAEIDQKIAV